MLLADSERGIDLLAALGVLFGESPDEADAAADHHVAVRCSEVGVECAASQLAALRDRRVAISALTLANCALFVWLARSQLPAKAIQLSLAYAAFELFAVVFFAPVL